MALTERTPSWIIYVDSNGVSHNVKAVYKGSKKVRPEWGWGGWTPWANTVIYYPLTSTTTVEDKSWNWYDLTNNGNVTFWTNAWVDCANFWTPWQGNHNLYYTNPTFLPSWNASRTMSIWAYNTRPSQHDSLMMFWWERSSYKLSSLFFDAWVYFAWYSADTQQYTFTTNTWHNVIATYDGSIVRLYLDGVEKGTRTTTLNTTTPKFWIGWGGTGYWSGNHYRDWYLSECIVEDVARTAQEVADYYDLTKWNYWL